MKLPAGSATKVIYAIAAIAVVASVVLAGVTCFNLSQKGASKTPYFVSESDAVLQVQTDGSIHVAEQRAYEAQGALSNIVWNMGLVPEEKNRLDINAIRLSVLDESGEIEQTYTLEKVAYDESWESGEGMPSVAAYSFNPSNSVLYVFVGDYAQKAPRQMLVSADYTIDHAVTAYRDVSEFEWVVVSGNNDAATKSASLTMSLPAPVSDASVADSIYAWSHGPESGTLEVADDGLVSYSVDMVDVWQYSTVRLDFPTSWLSSMSKEMASLHANELNLENAKKSEATWIDTWHGRTANSYLFDMVVIALFILVAVFALVIYLRHGKSRKPDFTETYCNEDPASQGLHPSMVGRIWRWNRVSADDLRAALVHLAAIGAVDVRREGDASAGGTGSSAVAGYRLVRVSEIANNLDDPIDRQTITFLFDIVARKAKDVRVQEIRSFKRDHASQYQAAVQKWQTMLDSQMEGELFIEKAGKRWQVRLILLAAVVFAIGLALFMLFGHPPVLAASVASAAVIALAANYVPRRTAEGNNIAARSKALRNWLRDDCQQSGIAPSEKQPFSQLLPYASIFGVVEESVEKASSLCEGIDECSFESLDDEDRHWYVCYLACALRKKNL